MQGRGGSLPQVTTSHWQGEGPEQGGDTGRARLKWEGEESSCCSAGKGEFLGVVE